MDKNLIIRLVVSVIACINIMAGVLGFAPLDIDENTVYTVVSAGAVVLSWAWGFWKNNNFTKHAKDAQEVLDMLKAGEE